MKKVYFCGSIRGGRADAELYRRMIEYMERTAVVLTKHVGDPLLKETAKDKEIYERDAAWLREADILIAECTCPSHGVGYEIAYGEAHGKPCHIFYNRNGARLSAMLAGDAALHVHPYEREEEIYPALDGLLAWE